jgi:hypothetical protein
VHSSPGWSRGIPSRGIDYSKDIRRTVHGI